ncbi:MAG: fatty acid desaturase [Hyphomicrobium sp.]|jgi:fatty acid desaturase|nr:fatty acid desaturase [Hyphomicrobium sp.]PPD07938.1 MAG: fatty acid desaturase [Hyphomicrobium sp.]
MQSAPLAASQPEPKSWALDKSVARELQRLKERDNHTNHRYLAVNYAIFIATVAATLWAFSYAETSGLGAWLTVPATVLAVIIIGGFQHQLGGAIHEGTHYILFADRKKNEIISDWFAAFPIYTSTYAFRLHHLAHHQFVNDPVRDPNFAQAEMSGHWLDFPLTQYELLMGVIRQLNPVRLVKYVMARARYSAIGSDDNPYADKTRMGSPWTVRVGALFAVFMPAVAIALILHGDWLALLIAHMAISAAVLGYYALIPEEDFARSRINPIVSHRVTALGRMGFLAMLYGALSLTCYLTGAPAWGWYGLLWILPLFTTFPLFMIAREWVQHGNADRGRLTNSRIFFVNPVVRWLVFPWGMDYHLPHHIYCSVPHYKLKDLHEVLLNDPEYREKGMVVHGVLGQGAPGMPSIVEVLGPRYTMTGEEISVQDDTLELADVNDKAAIASHSEASRQGAPR